MSKLEDDMKYPSQIANGSYLWVEKRKLDDLVYDLERQRKNFHELQDEYEKFKKGDSIVRFHINRRCMYQMVDTTNDLDYIYDDVKGELVRDIILNVKQELKNIPWYKRIFGYPVDFDKLQNKIESQIQIKRKRDE